MADEERKTLLKIEGDASGAKKAAQETEAALQKVGTTGETADAKVTESGKQAAQAIDQKTKKAGEAKSEFDQFARSMGTTERAAMRFREALARISPELAGLLDVGFKFGDIFSFGLSKMGAMLGGIGLAIAAIATAWNKVADAVRQAEEAVKRFAAENERIRVKATAAQAEATKAAASAGLPPQAIGKVRSLADRLAQQGADRSAALAAAPYMVDEAGQQIVSDEEALQIAVAQQFGLADGMKGAGKRQRERALRQMRKQLSRTDVAEAVGNAIADLRQAETTRTEQMAAGSWETEVGQYVEERTGLSGEELKKRTERVLRQLRGERRRGIRWPGQEMVIEREGFHALTDEELEKYRQQGYEIVPTDETDAMTIELQQRARARQPTTRPAAMFPEPMPPTTPWPRPSPTVVNNYYNHGVQVMGKDTRNMQIPRITNP